MKLIDAFHFRISRCFLPLAFNSKWLLVGTYCGNVFVVNLDTFTLSSYTIMWNNAIGMYETVLEIFNERFSSFKGAKVFILE